MISSASVLRIEAPPSFRLHWSNDEWATINDTISTTVPLGLNYVDIDVSKMKGKSLVFTFYWPDSGNWEGRDFRIEIA